MKKKGPPEKEERPSLTAGPSVPPLGEPFRWRSESDEPTPAHLSPVDDRLSADAALKRVQRGEYLLYTGDFHNARQLLGAMGRRLSRPAGAGSLLEAFRAERRARQLEHETLSRIVVALDRDYR